MYAALGSDKYVAFSGNELSKVFGRFFFDRALAVVSDGANVREAAREFSFDAFGAGAEVMEGKRSARWASRCRSGTLFAGEASIVAFRSVDERFLAESASEYGSAFRADREGIHTFARNKQKRLFFVGDGCRESVSEFFR